MTYDWKIGLKKTMKNILVTYGLPAILLFLNSYAEWLPKEYSIHAAVPVGAICYMIKNYQTHK